VIGKRKAFHRDDRLVDRLRHRRERRRSRIAHVHDREEVGRNRRVIADPELALIRTGANQPLRAVDAL